MRAPICGAIPCTFDDSGHVKYAQKHALPCSKAKARAFFCIALFFSGCFRALASVPDDDVLNASLYSSENHMFVTEAAPETVDLDIRPSFQMGSSIWHVG